VRLRAWLYRVKHTHLEALQEVAGTIRRGRTWIVNVFPARVTNGMTEGMHTKEDQAAHADGVWTAHLCPEAGAYPAGVDPARDITAFSTYWVKEPAYDGRDRPRRAMLASASCLTRAISY
jgi:Transposase